MAPKSMDRCIPAWVGFCSTGNWELELSDKDKPSNQEISAVVTKDGKGSSICKRLPLQQDQKERVKLAKNSAIKYNGAI